MNRPRSRPHRGRRRPAQNTEGATFLDIAEIKSKSIPELHEMADELAIQNAAGMRKQDLIFKIEQELLDSETVLRGEGVLVGGRRSAG